jgi:uncharacterized repeat protein (TIGR01451 family)
VNRKTRYSLIATILLAISLLLFPGSQAQRNENTQDDDGLIPQILNDTRPAEDNKPSGTSEADVLARTAGQQAGPLSGAAYVLVELKDAPAALVYAEVLASAPHSRSKALQAQAVRAAQSQSVRIEQQQRTLSAILEGSQFNVQELYRVHRALNGIAVIVDAGKVDELRRLPGVKAVRPIEPEYLTNSSSVPFIGAPQVWGGPLGLNVKGEGIKIGIIDTGIDYQHADFGGTGVLADYQANNRTVAPDAYFPTAKVVGGYDFAGDAYTASNAPVPDPDPMDCNGHGTHVAGTAAGYGVQADGTTYPGPFTDSANYGALRIGPGSAPGASLYALRVFGCTGSTLLTVSAIDWAIDPNNDDDFSDHLDVINMSLGGVFGSIADTSALASDNAALAGVIVVTSAGNSGDTFFIQGSPGAGSRVISTAASADSGLPGPSVRVNAPPGIAGNYVAGTAAFGTIPPVGGVTGNVVIGLDPADAAGPLTTDGCSPLTNAAAVAGNIALIDRGTCGFTVKVKTAQDAGAIAVIIANSAAGVFGNMGGADPTIVIPSVMVTFADGNTFKANIPGLNVTLFSNADTVASFSSRGPRLALSTSFASTNSFKLKPDITAPGLAITSAQTGVTCTAGSCQAPNASGFIPGSQPLILQGTSMASPHVAGVLALLRQLHPTWTVEELKALAMNGAIHDITTFPGGGGFRYSPSRIGAGRVDAVNSALSQVVAFNAEEPGLVSLSFDNTVLGTLTQTKKLRVVNNGATAQTFDLGVDTVTDAPGVSFSLPGGSTVTVPAGATVELDVQLSANASQMDHARDPTQSATQVVNAPGSIANLAIPRHWLTEEGSYVTFSQGGNLKLRVPVYTAPRPASDMSAPATITTGAAPTGSTTIPLSGTDVCTGTLAAGPTCNGTFPNDVESLVSPFELQVVSPRSPTTSDGLADLQYAGVAKDASRIWFGLSTWDKWSTPTDVSFSIYIDNNLDGTYDRIIFNTNSGTLARLFGSTVNQTDAFITGVFTPPGSISSTIAAATPNYTNGVSANVADTGIYNNRVMFMGATPAQLGLANVNAPFRYKIETCPGFAPLCQSLSGFHEDEAVGPYTWSGATQGLSFNNGGLLFEDLNGATIPVSWNLANMTANGSQGALLLHHHNVDGRQAEVVLVEGLLGAQSADLALGYSFAPANPTLGQNVTLTLTVTNNGPNDATGVQVSDPLPPGLIYVSDDGGGAYNPATGQWTVGALANTASATLNIVVTVDTTDEVTSTAQITAGTPLDPNPDNNQASITLMSPRQADLEMSMSVSSPTVFVGASVTYTLTVKNNGDDPAYSVSVSESFPAYPALNPSSYTASQGVYNPATGVWNLASLGKGNSATLTLTLNAPNIAGALTLEATATSGTSDPNTANNTASATTTVLSPATVTGTKTRSGSKKVGETVTYTVTLSNSGSYDQQDNPGAEFTDVLPAGLTLVSASATSGTATATVGTNTVTWDGVIPAGGSVTITITATNDGPEDQTISNQGTINYDADGNGVNEATALTDDPSVDGTSNPTSFVVCTVNPVVTTGADSGPGSLRYWIENACDGSTITFDLGSIGSDTITIADQLLLNRSLTIQGPGADQLTIQRDSAAVANFRIFSIDACTAGISGLTISNGKVTGGAGGAILNTGTLTLTDSVISHNSANLGGGIRNLGTLNIKGSTLSENSATGFGGLGGAISNAVAATAMVISNSTLSNNSAVNTGGAIHTASATVIINSTLSNNTAGSGGGIRNLALLGIINSTISGNSAVEGGGILSSLGAVGLTNVTITNNRATDSSATAGGGIKRTGGLFRLDNTIVAGNFKGAAPGTTASDIEGGNVGAASSYNLIGAGGAGGLTDGTNNNQIGVALSDLRIGPLASNGGPTQTHALLAGSPALDAGDNTLIPKDFLDQDGDSDTNEPVPFDQRGVGFSRTADAADADTVQTVDIGAFEADPSVEDIADKTTAEDTPLVFTFNVGDAATEFFSITATSLNQTLVPDANLTVGLDTDSTRTLSITPAADQSGTATIMVTVTKNIGGTTLSMTDTFVLTVTEVNDAPLANPDALTSVLEDSGQRTIPIASLISNDSVGANETGQLLTLSVVPGSAVGGTVTNDLVNVYFTPTADYNGPASFQYTVEDNGTTNGLADPQTSAPATVSFTITPVNDAPYLDAIGNILISEDASIQTVLMNNIQAGDAETDGLSITATSDNTGLIPNPTVSYTSPNAIGTLSFMPVPNQTGSAIITVTLTDNGGTANGGVNTIVRTFTVTVSAVNDAPVNIVPGAQTTMRNTALVFNGVNLIATSDVDAGASAVRVTLSATNGTVSLSGIAGLAFTVGDGTSDATMTFSGSIANINAALNNLSFTPTTDFNGAASIQLTTNDLGNTGTGGPLSDTDTVNITVLASTLQFSSANFTVGEGTGHATITVNRINDTSSPATVDYATGDLSGLTNCDVATGNASPRCDFTAVAGTLSFIAGQSSATFDVSIVNDVYVEGPETLPLILSNPTGGILGAQSTVTLTITDNDTVPGAANPIDDPSFFVRLQYMDILNREPDPQGFAAWLAIIQNCPQGDTTCDLVQVSSDFFRSPEFFDRAYYIYRFYEVGLGRKPDYDEYQRDFQLVAGFLTPAELEARKQQFALEFSQRADFRARYDQYDSATHSQEYVDALAQTAGVTLANRQQLNYELANSIKQRWDVLRAIVEGPEVSSKFFNKAFVVIGYFAFLRRDPDAQYLVWLAQLNNPPAGKTEREIYREMIAGFIFSQEYRHRFGP